jgi:dTDP-4-dehydrorhamnose reductase
LKIIEPQVFGDARGGGDEQYNAERYRAARITVENGFDAVLREHRPNAVIHCAVMTAVDKCEEAIGLAYRLNARGTANVAADCRSVRTCYQKMRGWRSKR